MEPPAKKARLLKSLDGVYNANYDNQHAYYGISEDAVNDYEEPEEEIVVPVYDPDQELRRKRARVDFKLKSTFEAIFEKYGKDFDSIGDEIDLVTGEILVNNGHLISMRHEADAGETQSQLSEELGDDISGSEEDDSEDEVDDDEGENDLGEENDEEDYGNEDALSDEEMVEDDMILRGFAQASQHFIHRRQQPEPGPSKSRFSERTEPEGAPIDFEPVPRATLPSRTEILAQFGPQLGPEIVKYVSERAVPENSNVELAWRVPDPGPSRRVTDIEPAWRVPDLESNSPPTPGRRPLIRSMVIRPESEIDRSQSPENAQSIWAVTEAHSSRKSASRKRFSPDEDQLLLDFVADVRRQGLDLSKVSTWKILQATDPRRDHRSWKQRYNTKFTYLRPSPLEESDLSTSEASSSTAQTHDQRLDFGMTFTNPAPARPTLSVNAHRPTRVRKPAQRDGVVSWSEAIATIASIDPVGNAGLLDDVRRTGFPLGYDMPVASKLSIRRPSLDASTPRRPVEQRQVQVRTPERRTDMMSGVEDGLAFNDSAYSTRASPVDSAPCPYANCKSYPSTQYRLEPGPNEELSPMCSHFYYEHHITPFPCGEANCDRKGAQGYFIQRDLIGHVSDAHPDPAAFHRLRGRVDPTLLGQKYHPDPPHQLSEDGQNLFTGKQPTAFQFMAPQRPHSNHGESYAQKTSLGFGQDTSKTPRGEAGAARPRSSSIRVHPSTIKASDTKSVDYRQASSDSDLQILDGSSMEENGGPKVGNLVKAVGIRDLDSYIPGSGTSFASAISLGESLSGARLDMPNSSYGRKTLNSYLGNSNQTTPPTSSVPKEPRPTIGPLPATRTPDAQCSQSCVQPKDSTSRLEDGQTMEDAKVVKPTWREHGVIDRSYEFSDDEDGVRPVIMTSQQQESLHQPVSNLQPFVSPPTKVESPQIPVLPKPADPSTSNRSFVTPSSKPKVSRSASNKVPAAAEFDELSLGENGFLLLSARPRSDKSLRLDVPVQVKHEEAESQPPLAELSAKRLFRSIEGDDDVDELAADKAFTSSLHQFGPLASSKRVSTTGEKTGIPSPRHIKAKPKKRPSAIGQPNLLQSQPTKHHESNSSFQ